MNTIFFLTLYYTKDNRFIILGCNVMNILMNNINCSLFIICKYSSSILTTRSYYLYFYIFGIPFIISNIILGLNISIT